MGGALNPVLLSTLKEKTNHVCFLTASNMLECKAGTVVTDGKPSWGMVNWEMVDL